jgi:DNA-binding response OmpR family regulator
MRDALLAELAELRTENDVLAARCAWLEGRLLTLEQVIPAEWRLSKTETKIAALLWHAKGRVVEHETIYSAVWVERNEPDEPRKNICVHIHRMQRKLKPFGVQIANHHSVGYQMITPHG